MPLRLCSNIAIARDDSMKGAYMIQPIQKNQAGAKTTYRGSDQSYPNEKSFEYLLKKALGGKQAKAPN